MLTMRAGTRRRVALLLRALGATVVIGAVVGGANGSGFRDAPLLGAMLGALGGATNGVILVGAILGAEILLPPTRLGHALERVPFLITFAITSARSDCVAAPRRCTSTRSRPSPQRMARRRYKWNRDCRTTACSRRP
jgi:hypothetical protein